MVFLVGLTKACGPMPAAANYHVWHVTGAYGATVTQIGMGYSCFPKLQVSRILTSYWGLTTIVQPSHSKNDTAMQLAVR